MRGIRELSKTSSKSPKVLAAVQKLRNGGHLIARVDTQQIPLVGSFRDVSCRSFESFSDQEESVLEKEEENKQVGMYDFLWIQRWPWAK